MTTTTPLSDHVDGISARWDTAGKTIYVPSGLMPTDVKTGGTYAASLREFVLADVTNFDVTVMIPPNQTPGAMIGIKLVSAPVHNLEVVNAGDNTIDGDSTYTFTAPYEWLILMSTGTGWIQVG